MERHSIKYGNSGVIALEKGFLNDEQLTLLFYAADIHFLPYKVTSGSGAMFDGFAHGLPYISSNIGFFKEFSEMGLGISVDSDPNAFSKALVMLEQKLDGYRNPVNIFRRNLFWEKVAKKHTIPYNLIMKNPNSPLLKENMF